MQTLNTQTQPLHATKDFCRRPVTDRLLNSLVSYLNDEGFAPPVTVGCIISEVLTQVLLEEHALTHGVEATFDEMITYRGVGIDVSAAALVAAKRALVRFFKEGSDCAPKDALLRVGAANDRAAASLAAMEEESIYAKFGFVGPVTSKQEIAATQDYVDEIFTALAAGVSEEDILGGRELAFAAVRAASKGGAQ